MAGKLIDQLDAFSLSALDDEVANLFCRVLIQRLSDQTVLLRDAYLFVRS